MGLPKPVSTLSRSPLYPRVNLSGCPSYPPVPTRFWRHLYLVPTFLRIFSSYKGTQKTGSGVRLNSATAREKDPLPKFFIALLE
jgi:hypothetical protein